MQINIVDGDVDDKAQRVQQAIARPSTAAAARTSSGRALTHIANDYVQDGANWRLYTAEELRALPCVPRRDDHKNAFTCVDPARAERRGVGLHTLGVGIATTATLPLDTTGGVWGRLRHSRGRGGQQGRPLYLGPTSHVYPMSPHALNVCAVRTVLLTIL